MQWAERDKILLKSEKGGYFSPRASEIFKKVKRGFTCFFCFGSVFQFYAVFRSEYQRNGFQ